MESNFAFSKVNYILLVVGFLIVLAGFILMAGPCTTEEAFEPDIFSTRRIVVAPIVSLFGFVFVIVAILWHPNSSTQKEEDTPNVAD